MRELQQLAKRLLALGIQPSEIDRMTLLNAVWWLDS